MIDLHCHLDLYPNPADVVKECTKRDLYVLSITNTPSAWIKTAALAKDNKKIKTALGLHPQLAKERISELSLFNRLITETKYVGEIGLDGSPEFSSFWDEQVYVFDQILKSCCKNGGRIISIHSRRASKEVIDHLEKNPGFGKAILHWFTGGKKDLQKAIDIGCWFSVGPAMLKSKNGKELIKLMPTDRVITETDGPFAMMNNTSLMPWDVEIAISDLGKLWNASDNEVRLILKNNFLKLLS